MATPDDFRQRNSAEGPSFEGSSAPRVASPATGPFPGSRTAAQGPLPQALPVDGDLVAAPDPRTFLGTLQPYLQMARVDHWFKNAFMLLGVLIALFHRPDLFSLDSLNRVTAALLIACVIASSNYVLNEYLDAPLDRLHPTKRWRPAARGLVQGWAALLLWGALGAFGILAGFRLNPAFGTVCFVFWAMACAYNIPPVRTKDVAYLDVVSESINNPLRLCLGWFALIPDVMPSLSLAISYWMIGAFFMAAKRFAEYRQIGDAERAARYRRSFRHYDDPRLMASMFFYASVGSVFAGVFLVRHRLELVLCVPLVAAFLGHYALLATRDDSPVQAPEKLYRERSVMAGALLVLVAFLALMSTELPFLYDLFNVAGPAADQLWTLGN